MLNTKQSGLVKAFVFTLTAVLLLTGCGSNASTPEPETSPTAVSGTPTASPATTPTPAAESTIVGHTPTITPTPGAVIAPPATATSVVPSPTAEDEAVIEEDDPLVVYDLSAIQSLVDAMVAETDGNVAVVLADANGTVLLDWNGSESMEAASLYKVPVMVEVFRQFEAGIVQRDSSVLIAPGYFNEGADSIGYEASGSYVAIDTLLFAMIAQSSNVAAYALLDLVGNDNVNASMAELRLDSIEIRWSPRHGNPDVEIPQEDEYIEEHVEPEYTDEPTELPESQPEPQEELEQPEREEQEETINEEVPEDEQQQDPEDSGYGHTAQWLGLPPAGIAPTLRADAAFNVVSASDLAQLLVMLVKGELVSERASSEMLDLLAQQQIPGGLPGELPDGAVAHKTGYLEDGVINDAGIISSPVGQMIAVVLTESVREDLAYNLMSSIGTLLYELNGE